MKIKNQQNLYDQVKMETNNKKVPKGLHVPPWNFQSENKNTTGAGAFN